MEEYGRRNKNPATESQNKPETRNEQHVLITILVVEGHLEVVGKDIPRKIAQMIELKRKVADP